MDAGSSELHRSAGVFRAGDDHGDFDERGQQRVGTDLDQCLRKGAIGAGCGEQCLQAPKPWRASNARHFSHLRTDDASISMICPHRGVSRPLEPEVAADTQASIAFSARRERAKIFCATSASCLRTRPRTAHPCWEVVVVSAAAQVAPRRAASIDVAS
jgi:hypothetical protein